jgi:hypothetical protein
MKFSHKEWDELVDKTIKQIHYLSSTKGGEYAGDDDRLANFRRNASEIGVSMEVVWRIYIGKHWDSISQYIKDIQTGKDRDRSEPLEGRFDDLIVYAILGKAILRERERNKNKDVIVGDEKKIFKTDRSGTLT